MTHLARRDSSQDLQQSVTLSYVCDECEDLNCTLRRTHAAARPCLQDLGCRISSDAREVTGRRNESNGATTSLASPRFTKLPRELRDKIYEYLLARQGVLELFKSSASHPGSALNLPVDIYCLGRISTVFRKEFREEAIQVFLSRNRFRIAPLEDPHDLKTLIYQLRCHSTTNGHHLKHLRHIELSMNCRFYLDARTYYRWHKQQTISYTFDVGACMRKQITCTTSKGKKSYCVCDLEERLTNLLWATNNNTGMALIKLGLYVLEAGRGVVEVTCETCGKLSILSARTLRGRGG